MSARQILVISLLTCLLAPVGSAHAQVRISKQPDFQPDIQNVDGYTVRVFRMQRGSYGYEIDRGSRIFVHQRRNPYTGSLRGLSTKADARTTALWVLDNIVKTEQMRPRSQQLPDDRLTRFIPLTVAAQLGVTLDSTR